MTAANAVDPRLASPGRPIADYALLSDCHSAALVSGAGSVDWLCLPRFDAPATFARLLDPEGGHWSITPVDEYDMSRRYLPGSLVLETRFATSAGVVSVRDALVFDADERGHAIGLRAPHVLVRVVEGISGSVEVDVEVAPRMEYGLVVPRLSVRPGGVFARSGATVLVLAGPPPQAVDEGCARWDLRVGHGDRIAFALQSAASWEPVPDPLAPEAIERRLEDTLAGWQSWSDMHTGYDGPWRELVRHSGRVLQGLTYRPTGAIVAAPTTSLPELVGGGRNWDYRYAWVRDASMTLDALWVAACPDEAGRFLSWLVESAGAAMDTGESLQIVYGVGGEHDLTERELPHLRGWRDSAPVRVGNGAWQQCQLDVHGALLDAVLRLSDTLGDLDPATVGFLVGLADEVERLWEEADSGMWEGRGDPQHFLSSKVMCWVALDRAVALAERLGAGDRAPGWRACRERIRGTVLAQGWNDEVGAYTQAFGSTAIDASALLLPIVGFLPATDPRMLATIRCVQRDLGAPCGLIYRYSGGDGMEGREATFVLCTYWLVQCLALAGELDEARALFEKTTAYANDVGLLAEEVDPWSGSLLGNFPQAFSHIGLVNAAYAIDRASLSQPVAAQ